MIELKFVSTDGGPQSVQYKIYFTGNAVIWIDINQALKKYT